MSIPTEKLTIIAPTDPLTDFDRAALEQIRAFAAELVVRGERPWFEVWYPSSTADDFDAVEVAEDGTITTLPPYTELVT